jgi:hypothetical protein
VLLRELRWDNLPGAAYYIAPPKAVASGPSTDFSSIGVGSANKNKKKAGNVNSKQPLLRTIRRAGICGDDNAEVHLVIQILDHHPHYQGQSISGAPVQGEMRLWVSYVQVNTSYDTHITINPQNADGTETLEMTQVSTAAAAPPFPCISS